MIIPKTTLLDNINREINDNSKGQITPHDIRHNLIDIIDSVHRLTEEHDLKSKNLDTTNESSRTTRLGNITLDNFRQGVENYTSIDNTAIGYSALTRNYQGSQNTAIGSYSLSCNIYGQDNVAIGFNSLAGNSNGAANIAIGSYSLNSNKVGNFNIGIGHAAGYYVDPDVDYQFFLTSHNVDDVYLCQNESGADLVPFLQGDMTPGSMRLGIGVKTLSPDAALQVEGSIHPNTTMASALGSSSKRWTNVFLSNGLYFDEDQSIIYSNTTDKFNFSSSLNIVGGVVISEDMLARDISSRHITSSSLSASGSISGDYLSVTSSILRSPTSNDSAIANIGSSSMPFHHGYFVNVHARGKAFFSKIETTEQNHYLHKTLHLASSGDINTLDGGGPKGLHDYFNGDEIDPPSYGYLQDEQLAEAGLIIKSYDPIQSQGRDYHFTFKPNNPYISNLASDTPYSRNSWNSNISITVANGSHIEVDRILNHGNLDLVNYRTENGIFIKNRGFNVGREVDIKQTRKPNSDINIVSELDVPRYSMSMQSRNLNTNLDFGFFGNTSSTTNKRGFEQSYIVKEDINAPYFFNPDEGNSYERLALKSYSNSDIANRAFVFLQDNNEGVIGINNFNYAEYMMPDTILNIRSTGNAIIRTTAENTSSSDAGIQMLVGSNALVDGSEIKFSHDDLKLEFNLYKDSDKIPVIHSISGNDKISILGDLQSNAMITVGDSIRNEASIALRHSPTFAISTNHYGTIFTRSNNKKSQTSTLSFVDSSGNYFDVNMFAIDSAGGLPTNYYIYSDEVYNTLGGRDCPAEIADLTSAANNTAYGHSALTGLTNANHNVAIGSFAGYSVANQAHSSNIFIGSNAGKSIAGSGNLYIGRAESPIVVDGISSSSTLNNVINIDNVILSNKETDKTHLNTNYIGLGKTTNAPVSSFVISESQQYTRLHSRFEFSVYNNDTKLFTANSNGTTFTKPIIVSDTIRFSDGSTSIESGDFLDHIDTIQSDLDTAESNLSTLTENHNTLRSEFDASIVEGFAETNILAPSDPQNPTTGKVKLKIMQNGSWNDKAGTGLDNPPWVIVSNRDRFLDIYAGDYVIAIKVNGEYRPMWVSYQS